MPDPTPGFEASRYARFNEHLSEMGLPWQNKKAQPVSFRHDDGRRVTLHVHRPGQTLPIRTLREIIENEVRWNEEDLMRLRLV